MREDEKAPFTEHLEELRKRLITCIIAVLVGFVITYAFKEQLFQILIRPLVAVLKDTGGSLIFTGVSEAFFTYLKVAFLAGLLLASPVVFYEFWMFVAPGLYTNERRLLLPIVLLSSIFFVGGVVFGYYCVFPFGFKFFLSFSNDTIKAMPAMQEYLKFSTKLLLAFGLVFELPLVLTFLARLGIVSADFLRKKRKYSLILAFIFGAILTPPDVVSQIMMALPLVILYEVSILGAKIFGKKKQTEVDEDEPAEA